MDELLSFTYEVNKADIALPPDFEDYFNVTVINGTFPESSFGFSKSNPGPSHNPPDESFSIALILLIVFSAFLEIKVIIIVITFYRRRKYSNYNYLK
jgi:hypothetical protein